METQKKRKTFSEILDDDDSKDAIQKFILVNETPHYPVSFITEGHLCVVAEMDTKVDHPLGTVYMTKGIDQDNDIRIVVLRSKNADIALRGFIFSKKKWNAMGNPFSEIRKEIGETSFPSTVRFLCSFLMNRGRN